MRVISLIFILSSLFFPLSAQKEIKGFVRDNRSEQSVSGLSITLHKVGSTVVLSYTISADDGYFSLSTREDLDSLVIIARGLNYEAQEKIIGKEVNFVDFQLQEKTYKIKEIVIKAPKIQVIGDTVNYLVSSFTDATDRSIGDVLKKLPGIDVLASGQILYQNKPIRKFYVEGLDLLKGKYGLATHNVDPQQVASVQVLERHEPIKLLKGMNMPEQAAINLKLKKSTIGAFFVNAQIGAGYPLGLLSNELVSMRFASSQQNMLIYKGDNTGRDIASELNSFYHSSASPPRFLSLVAPLPPAIKKQHQLLNDAQLFTLNDLRRISKRLNLTSNLHYLHDKQRMSSFSEHIILTGERPVIITETSSSQLLKRELEGTVTLERNDNQTFLENRVNFFAGWNNHFGDLTSSKQISQGLFSPILRIGNELKYLKRKEKNIFHLESKINYTQQNQSLRVTPRLFENLFEASLQESDLMRQDLSYKHFKTNTSTKWTKSYNRLNIDYDLLLYTDHYLLTSNLYASSTPAQRMPDSLRNQLERNQVGLQLTTLCLLKPSFNTTLSLSLPFAYMYLWQKDTLYDNKRKSGHLLLTPKLMLNGQLSSKFSFMTGLSFANSVGSIEEAYSGLIMTNYRQLKRNNDRLRQSAVLQSYGFLNYKNPFSTLFANFSLSYSTSFENVIRDMRYDGVLSTVSLVEHPFRSHSFSSSYGMGKDLDAIRTIVKLSLHYNKGLSSVMQQKTISDYSYNAYSISPSFTTEITERFIVKYNATIRRSQNEVEGYQKLPPILLFSQQLSSSYLPLKGLELTLTANHYYNNHIESSARSLWFSDLSARYKFPRATVMMDWTNLLNTSKFISYSYNESSSYYSVYTLRPSEIMFRVRFKLL